MLKALALVLGEHLPISRRCMHVKGRVKGERGADETFDGCSKSRFGCPTSSTGLSGYLGDPILELGDAHITSSIEDLRNVILESVQNWTYHIGG